MLITWLSVNEIILMVMELIFVFANYLLNVIGICLSHGTEWLHYSPGTPSFPAV